MKKLKMVLLFTLIFSFGALVFANSASLANNNDEKSIVEANNQFAIELYKKLKGENGNVFFSPFSVFDALSMTYAGARGETEKQMANVLHITLPQNSFHRAFSNVMKKIKADGQSVESFNIANALWCQKNFHFLQDFLSLVKKYYDGDAFNVDFSKPETIKEINDWVSDQTHGKINKIIGKIDSLTRLIITNAIYFKGKWVSGFNASSTKVAPFYVKPNDEVKAEMMYQEAEFNYMENDTLQAIEMPYKGGNLSMIVLLPKNNGYGINELESSLTTSNLKVWISKMKEQEVKVYFPKFKLRTNYELENVLKSMGMSDAFSNADFSGMDGAPDLQISKVIHKAYVDVNEEGTEAAAVTAVIVVLTCSPNYHPPKIPIFRADHPFIFFIIDKTTNSILFMGKVVNPTK